MTDASAVVGAALNGIQAQLRRAERFRDSVDPAAALQARLALTEFLEPRLPDLREAAGLPREPGRRADGHAIAARDGARADVARLGMYTFWNAPIAEAPPLVQACVRRLTQLHPELHILDGSSARELIDIPPAVADRLEEQHPAHFSDFVRVSLLDRYGGIWLDATCWLPDPLRPGLTPLLTAGVVYPRWTRHQIGNWFIAAVAGTPVIGLQKLALEAWWTERGELVDYFLYHRVFEVLLNLVPEFRGQWNAAPVLPSAACHLLQLGMMQPWRPDQLELALRASIVQKLSYKYDEVPPGSVLERMLSGLPLV